MVQTDLKSDNFCGYNQAASSFYWILDPVQNNEQYNVGEVGVPTDVGLNTPAQVIEVSNFLSDRENVLTKCIPPVPSWDKPGTFNTKSDNLKELEIIGMNYINKGETKNLPVKDQYVENFTISERLDPRYENILSQLKHNRYNHDLDHYNKRYDHHLDHYDKRYYDIINKEQRNEMIKKAHSVSASSPRPIPDDARTNSGNTEKFTNIEPEINTATFLLPEYTRTKGVAKDLSAVNLQGSFGGNAGNLYTEPQNLTYVIERMALERGGLNSNQLIKDTWNFANTNSVKIPDGNLEPTNKKIKHPYPIDAPFGLKFGQESKNFNANDVVSTGVSSPVLDQNLKQPYNYSAKFNNGGCNNVSLIKNNTMCSNISNDLTGLNVGFQTVPPQGI
jgi:hypothetical protein